MIEIVIRAAIAMMEQGVRAHVSCPHDQRRLEARTDVSAVPGPSPYVRCMRNRAHLVACLVLRRIIRDDRCQGVRGLPIARNSEAGRARSNVPRSARTSRASRGRAHAI